MSLQWLVLAAASAATVAAGAAAIANVSPDESVMAALKFPTEYNRAARPPPDNGNANTVNVFVFFNGITRLHWTDTRLSWYNKFNATLDSIDFIIVPASLLWQPDVSFLEAIELKDVGNSRDFVMLHNDGTLLRSGGMVLTSKCKMEMYRFPFDLQTCALRIATIFDTTGSTSLGILPLNISHELYLNKSNEFCILGLDYEISKLVEKNVPEFRITFQRMSTFYVVNLMLPSILLLAISALAFRMPPECGERVSFSITIVLSMCVFLQLAGNYTPTQSESIPLITWYFSVTLLMTILNVLCNAFVLSCHFKKQCSLKVSNRFIRVLFFNRIMMKSTAGAKISPSDSVGPQPQQNQEDTTVKFENDWADRLRKSKRMSRLLTRSPLCCLKWQLITNALQSTFEIVSSTVNKSVILTDERHGLALRGRVVASQLQEHAHGQHDGDAEGDSLAALGRHAEGERGDGE
uniref:Neur_chan_LBD domain-containing protein n=1 Tax=Macrostomum lignano TaxID=282301 RepID=A0A1I8JJA8_9PLAT